MFVIIFQVFLFELLVKMVVHRAGIEPLIYRALRLFRGAFLYDNLPDPSHKLKIHERPFQTCPVSSFLHFKVTGVYFIIPWAFSPEMRTRERCK